MTRAWTGNTDPQVQEGRGGLARAVHLARDQAVGARPDDPRHQVRQGRRQRAAAAAAVLHPAAPRLGADRRQRRQGPQGLRPGARTSRSSAAAPSTSPSTTRRARRSSTRNPGFYGTRPHLDAVGISWFANSDAMLAALKSNDLDYVDSVPQTVADHARQVGRHPGRHGPGHRGARLRLQLEPEEEEEPRAARSRSCATRSRTPSTASRSIDVVFRGLARAARDAR